MKTPTTPLHRPAWLRTKVSAVLLISLLQRTPAVRLVQAASAVIAASPIGAVLKSALTAAAALGAMHSLAGATTLVSSSASPLAAKVGVPITPVAFTVSDTINIASWNVGGAFPPGVTLVAREGNVSLSGPGKLDATSPGAPGADPYAPTGGGEGAIVTTTPYLMGTPTQAGTFTLTLQAAQPNATAGSLVSAVFNYTIVVAADVAPPPTSVAPSISAQPQSQTVATGSTAVFTAAVTGGGVNYQWRRGTVTLPGATSATLVVNAASSGDAGAYSVVATNSAGSVTSTSAILEVVNETNFGHLVNLSIRAPLSAEEPFFTVGTVVGGAGTSGAKPLLVRAVGPSLAAFGLSGAITDARVDVLAGASSVASNNDWNGDATLSSAFAQVGAFPLASATSKDAAVFSTSFAARDYTVQVGGVGGATGEVLAELYDATASGAFGPTTPRLINVSVRKQIDAGSTLTAGFVIGGNTARTVLVRALGPALAAFGVAGTMADPQLALFSGAAKVAENDNWGGDAQLTSVGASVGAFAIAGATSKDAVLLLTLAPGSYTAQVSGVAGTGGGSTLVEIYEVP